MTKLQELLQTLSTNLHNRPGFSDWSVSAEPTIDQKWTVTLTSPVTKDNPLEASRSEVRAFKEISQASVDEVLASLISIHPENPHKRES